VPDTLVGGPLGQVCALAAFLEASETGVEIGGENAQLRK
jgi:hypothetical protein